MRVYILLFLACCAVIDAQFQDFSVDAASTLSTLPFPPTSLFEVKKFCKLLEIKNNGKSLTSTEMHKIERRPKGESIELGKLGLDIEKEILALAKLKGLTSINDFCDEISVKDIKKCLLEQFQAPEIDCDQIEDVDKFRTIDGKCNNRQFPTWGTHLVKFLRFLPPDYGGSGFNEPTRERNGELLPQPRTISVNVHPDKEIDSNDHSFMLMQWGQFLDHDFTLATEGEDDDECENCATTDERCFNIPIPSSDPQFGSGSKFPLDCLPFVRSQPSTDSCNGVILPREQTNEITAYIDASNVYGNEEELADLLRTKVNGLLKTNFDGQSLPFDFQCNPAVEECNPNPPCMGPICFCFLAGDRRSTEQTLLATMHTLWVREHNRIARLLRALNRFWDDERLYQEARRIVGALHQKITYDEWAPELLGRQVFKRLIPPYRGYDKTVNAGILSEFATAALRMGHSQLRNDIRRLDDGYVEIDQFRLRDSFFQTHRFLLNPNLSVSNDNLENLFRGLLEDNSRLVDRFVSTEVTNNLFTEFNPSGVQTGPGMDLASLNIQRGRDHGLRPYIDYRTYALQKLETMDIPVPVPIMTKANKALIRAVYGSVQQCDLWVCALLERSIEQAFPASQRTGGQLGPTFSVIFADQLIRSRDGDRFFYQNPDAFTCGQLQAIEDVTLSAVICQNSEISTIQPNAFREPNNDSNRRIRCGAVRFRNGLNLRPWLVPCQDHFSESFCDKLKVSGGCTSDLVSRSNCLRTCNLCDLQH